MNRLALVLGLLALLVPAGATGRGSTAPGPARQTSIFYYPWYGNPQVDGSFMHWNQNGHIPPLDLATSYYPARGPYSSADPGVVAAQMKEIAGAGIQEVVSSWWGWGSIEDLRLPMIVRMAAKQGLKVAAQIEPYTDRTAASVASDIAHLRALGIGRFYVYHPFEVDDAGWSALLGSLPGVQVLAQTANVSRAAADHFAGVYTYDIFTFGPATFGSLCARAHRAGLLCAPSVGPGYDALRATGDTRIRPRDGGSTYDAMWKAAIQSGADRVTITSYNEWHEGTQIEPALTPLPRKLTTASHPATSPVARAYASYDGTYGLHGRQAARAYLVRTAYWTGVYRTGSTTSTRRTEARKPLHRAGNGRLGSNGPGGDYDSRVCSHRLERPESQRPCRLSRVSPFNLLLGALPSRLMPAVRVTGSDTVVRPLGRAAPWTTRGSREWSCYRARRPQALLGMSVITRCASSSERLREYLHQTYCQQGRFVLGES